MSVLSSLFVTPVFAWDFLSDVAAPLLTEWGYGDERAYDFGIDDTQDLRENLKKIFYPDATADNQIWKLLRNILAGVLVLAIIYTWAQFVLYADQPEEVNKNLLNLVFILIGALAIFLSVWILDTLLNIRNISGVWWSDPNSLTSKFSDVALLVLWVLKGFAFFLAIIMVAYNGLKMLYSVGAEDKVKAAWQWVLNVVMALLFIKIIDYLYYIAWQSNFWDSASILITQISRVLGWVLWVWFVLAIIYAWYIMITWQWNDERIGQAKSLIKSVAVVGLVILIFLLVIFQIFWDIGA
jgi:hypothetical protein